MKTDDLTIVFLCFAENKGDILLTYNKNTGKPKKADGIFLSSNDVITISANFDNAVTMTVLEARAGFLKVNQTTLKLFKTTGEVWEDFVPTEKTWQFIKYDIPDEGVPNVERLTMDFFAPEGELKIKNIFFRVCVETGSCHAHIAVHKD